jgi:hypothetical protein
MSDDEKNAGKLVLSIEEAAETLSVMAEVRLVRLGRRLLVPMKELERWIDRNAGTPLIADLARIAHRRGSAEDR